MCSPFTDGERKEGRTFHTRTFLSTSEFHALATGKLLPKFRESPQILTGTQIGVLSFCLNGSWLCAFPYLGKYHIINQGHRGMYMRTSGTDVYRWYFPVVCCENLSQCIVDFQAALTEKRCSFCPQGRKACRERSSISLSLQP